LTRTILSFAASHIDLSLNPAFENGFIVLLQDIAREG